MMPADHSVEKRAAQEEMLEKIRRLGDSYSEADVSHLLFHQLFGEQVQNLHDVQVDILEKKFSLQFLLLHGLVMNRSP